VTRLAGDRVILRSYRPDELERLVTVANAAPTGDGIHWGPREPDDLRKKIEASGAWYGDRVIEFAVEAEGRLVGEVQARTMKHAMPPGVFELGIEIFDRPDRGSGLGAAAIREITRFLFREEDAIRVQLSTDVDNAAMRRVADRLGFGFEGVQRGFMPTADGPRDYAMYGMTSDDFTGNERRATWT
jgi:[ribosomal protein S5]-alanine N-acetyltransferase